MEHLCDRFGRNGIPRFASRAVPARLFGGAAVPTVPAGSHNGDSGNLTRQAVHSSYRLGNVNAQQRTPRAWRLLLRVERKRSVTVLGRRDPNAVDAVLRSHKPEIPSSRVVRHLAPAVWNRLNRKPRGRHASLRSCLGDRRFRKSRDRRSHVRQMSVGLCAPQLVAPSKFPPALLSNHTLALIVAIEYSWCNPPSTDFASTSTPAANRCRSLGFETTPPASGGSGTPGPSLLCGLPVLPENV